MGTGLILLDAIKAANDGKSLDEIMSVIEDSKKGITILINSFSVRNLPTDNAFEWMKKALIEFDHPFPTFRIIDGTAEEIEIKKGNHTAFDQFYAYCLEALINEKPQYAVGYASRSKEARATALLLEEELGYPPVALFETGVFTTYVTGTAGILLVFRDKTNIE